MKRHRFVFLIPIILMSVPVISVLYKANAQVEYRQAVFLYEPSKSSPAPTGTYVDFSHIYYDANKVTAMAEANTVATLELIATSSQDSESDVVTKKTTKAQSAKEKVPVATAKPPAVASDWKLSQLAAVSAPADIDVSIPHDDAFLQELKSEIHRLTNVERKKAKLALLTLDNSLANIATLHSTDMAKNDYFSHTTLSGCDYTCRFDKAKYKATSWGENIAWRSEYPHPTAAALAKTLISKWMASPGHRKNMLSSNYTKEGVGVAAVGDKIYATVDFSLPQ